MEFYVICNEDFQVFSKGVIYKARWGFFEGENKLAVFPYENSPIYYLTDGTKFEPIE